MHKKYFMKANSDSQICKKLGIAGARFMHEAKDVLRTALCLKILPM